MRVTIGYLDEFKRGAKALRKKYPLTKVFIAGVVS